MRIQANRKCGYLTTLAALFSLHIACNGSGHTPDSSVPDEQTEALPANAQHAGSPDSLSTYRTADAARYLKLARTFFTLHRYDDADRILRAVDSCGLSDRRLDSLLTTNLLAWAEESLSVGDSVTFARCLLRLTRRPLPHSVLHTVSRLIKIGYPVTPVTDNVVADYAPRFFPDGRTIVYFSRLQRERLDYQGLHTVRYQTQICIVDTDGKNPTVISDGRASEFFPDVSPDGRYIVCQRAEGDTLKGEWTAARDSYLYLYDLQSGRGRRLGNDRLYGQCPRFTPTGESVVFVTGYLGREGYISTIDMRTEETTPRYRRTNPFRFNKPGAVFYPSFFPDGKRMVFQAGFLRLKGVYISDEYGRDIVRLTQNAREWYHDPREWNPAVSPEGKNIVFISDGADGEELFICHVDGTARRQITFDGYDKAFPAYSPDGRFIAFGAKKKGHPDADYEIYILDLSFPAGQAQIASRVRELARQLGVKL